jgi:serine/threonine-protein kinase
VEIDSAVDTSPTASPIGTELEEDDPLAGTRYEAQRELGRGGMGTVYLARHRDLGRLFAVKVLSKRLSADPVLVERMRREARTSSQIRHPGIVDVTDIGETLDGRTFIVMEHLEGETLRKLIKRRGRLDQLRALEIARELAEALIAAHAHDIIHRDIKPANVIVAREGSPFPIKLLDFGISLSPEHATDRLTKVGAMPGTPPYMAPEQATTRTATVLTDVYALGVVLYEMLTGTPPFVDAVAVVLLARKREEDPEPPRRRAPDAGIHAAVEALVLRAIARDPAARFQSMQELAAAIDATREAVGARAAAPRAPGAEAPPASGRHRRSRYVALVVLTVAGAVLVGYVGALVARGNDGQARSSPAPASVVFGGADTAPGEPDATPPAAAGDGQAPPTAPSALAEGGGDAGAEPPFMDFAGDAPPSGDGSASTRTPEERRASAALLEAEGRRQLSARRLSEARQTFLRAARLDPGSAAIHGGLGRTAFELGQYAEAAEHLERALKQRPRDVGLRTTLGSAYLRMGQRDKAVRSWNEVLRQDPDNAAARRLLTAAGQGR